ncbi:MAG: aldose 1-epimerase [Bacteroidota bacterium]
MIELKLFNQKAKIDTGELIGYQVDQHEFIHQKGSPGWRSSDTEMFPIIGPTHEADFRVQVPRAYAVLDQHGHLRELTYDLTSRSDTKAVFEKVYKAGTPVINSKFPEKSTARRLIWPFDFKFQKAFELKEGELEITFTVSGEKDMPFMLGYHPAFKLYIDHPQLVAGERNINLEEVLEVGSRALEVPDCDTITLKDKNQLTIETEGFGNFMLWTEVPQMICIEPITFYPYAVDQKELHEGFQYLESSEKVFKVHIKV